MSNHKKNISIFLFSEDEFYQSREIWNDLLKRSNSDQFFMSWEWISTWWKVFSDPNMELKLMVVKDNLESRLLGIAPMYLIPARIKGIIKVNRLQFIGNCWHGKKTMRTELVNFIYDKDHEVEIVSLMSKFIINEINWDECAFKDIETDSLLFKEFKHISNHNNYYLKIYATYKNYHLNLNNDFKNYLSSLSQNTRRKIFNKRNTLEKSNNTNFNPNYISDINHGFFELNKLHLLRWEKPAFKDEFYAFNIKIAELFQSDDQLRFSCIAKKNEVISIQYNYCINNQLYNLQSGFDQNLRSNISLGYLHFGYEIENAFNDGLEKYHFLAGEGKNLDYKAKLTKDSTLCLDCIIVRNFSTRLLYKLYDSIQNLRQVLFKDASV